MLKAGLHLLSFLCLLAPPTANAAAVHVAVASNFLPPLRAIERDFAASTGHSIIVSSAASGTIYAQIKSGAPYEVFLSGNREYPERLIKEGLALEHSLTTYAFGRLALWSAKPGLVDGAGAVLSSGRFKRLAIANPKLAPYGAAARQVLEKKALLETLDPKLVVGQNISQAYQFVATQNAELGFVALSQIKESGQTGSWWLVPTTLHEPIAQGAVLLKRAQTNAAARIFLEFLKTEKVKATFSRFGYD